MSKTSLLLMILGFGSLTVGLSFAADQIHARHSKSKEDAQASEINDKAHKTRDARPTDGDVRRDQNTRDRHDSGDKRAIGIMGESWPTYDFHPSALKEAVAKDGLMREKANSYRQQPAKSLVGGGTTALSPDVPRKHIVTAASIGGLLSPSDRHSAAVIDGSQMNRRP